MYKYFFLLLLPFVLFANLTYQSNYKKEVTVLGSLNIEPSFLYDPIMSKMRNKYISKGENNHFFKIMNNGYIFIPAINNTLTKYGIPHEFLYLAMAESNFRTKAYSKKKAAGLWQFMPQTARKFHLAINEYVDERRDFIKSTEAAAKYLTALHRHLGKWYLAAIAYNCGEGRLKKAIKEAGTDKLSILASNKEKYLPKESRYYIRKIVALALVGADDKFLFSSEYGYLLNRANAYPIATVKLSRGDSLTRVARLLHMPLKDLQKINRELKYDFVPPYAKSYNVYIPYIKLAEFKQKYYEAPMKNLYKLHIVSSGDNLSSIGKEYGVSYKIIKDFNHLRSNCLSLHQKLIIPISKISKKEKAYSQNYYMVRRGDSLGSISKTFKVSVENIKIQNHIRGSLIRVGERLKIYE